MKPPNQIHTYKDAGVDIDAGNEAVEAIKHLNMKKNREGSDIGLSGFGALFDIKKEGFIDPILVAAADGVGTKLRIAIQANHHQSVGIDLVAMCVNDLIVQGAKPLFFLDYFATGSLSGIEYEKIILGIIEGCRLAECDLIGGETAEMPGMYQMGDYDLAGFAVGAVEREQLLPKREEIRPGDIILGLASSGLHSNGFSLVRNVIEDSKFDYGDEAPFEPGRTLADILLKPTKIYVRSCLKAVESGLVKGLAHITGGGIGDNLPRILPENVSQDVDFSSWTTPTVFTWLAEVGAIPAEEMRRTFNCGIGMAIVVAPESVSQVTQILEELGELVSPIGEIIDGHEVGGSHLTKLDAA